ncbi:MAG: EF-hand domain-containing protein [Rhodospirillales bacterium]|nr:EF-hand domain-containing protein [Rhodospirillales bacterium]
MPKSKVFPLAVLALAATSFIAVGAATADEKDKAKSGWKRPHTSRIIEILDTNKDGKVSFKEITDEQGRMLGAIDVDGDGAVSVDEFKRRGRLIMSLRTTTFFDLLDANGDGKLSAEELAAPSQRWFNRYDENKDGALASDEIPSRSWARHGGPRGR